MKEIRTTILARIHEADYTSQVIGALDYQFLRLPMEDVMSVPLKVCHDCNGTGTLDYEHLGFSYCGCRLGRAMKERDALAKPDQVIVKNSSVKTEVPETTDATEGHTPRERPVPLDHIAQFFTYSHLPEPLAEVSKVICESAQVMMSLCPRNPERTAGLRKLLEAKDCFVRAFLAKEDV